MLVVISRYLLAWLGIIGIGLDLLGGLFVAYELLGGQRGPLRTIIRAAGYALFFTGFYTAGLSVPFGPIAGAGLGILLGVEYGIRRGERAGLIFAVARGAVFGLAGLALHGPRYGLSLGVTSAVGLVIVYRLKFSVAGDYPTPGDPRIRGAVAKAQTIRVAMTAVAAVTAGIIAGQAAGAITLFVVRLAATAWLAGTIVATTTRTVESWVDRLQPRRLGILGAALFLSGLLTQSVQYWVVILHARTG